MRVIYILSPTIPFGGAAKSLLATVMQLRNSGVTPLMVMPDEGELCSRLRENGVEYRVLNYRFGVYPPVHSLKDFVLFVPRLMGRVWLNRSAVRQICSIAEQFKPDLIHTNVGVLTIGYQAARRLRIPHVWHIREYGDKHYHYCFYPTNRSHRQALQDSYTICISRDLARYNGLEGNERSRVIYNGAVSAKTDKANVQERENIFLFIGRIERGKGLQEMVEALLRSLPQQKQRHTLLLLGSIEDKPYYEEIRQSVVRANAEDYVRFTGEVPAPAKYIRKAKAVIIPAHYEGFGRVMPETMMLGTPVIAYNNAGSKEQLDNGLQLTGGEIGLRYTTTDQLTNHITSVANNGLQPLEQMLQRAQQTVRALYTNEQNASQVLAFYNEILSKRPIES